MGGIVSRFRSKPTTKEILEDIQKEIDGLEENKRNTELQQKTLVRSLIKWSCFIYFCLAVLFVYYFYRISVKDRMIYCIPLIIVPILFYIFKKLLHFYFIQKIQQNEENLVELHKRKKSILEFAMETETYRNVKELLDKYDPVYYKKVFEPKPAITAGTSTPLRGSFGDNTDIRRRNISPKLPQSATMNMSGQMQRMISPQGLSNPFPNFPGKPYTNPGYPSAFYQRVGPQFARPPMLPMPRPLLPRERTFTDRLVDYIVGDGPSNRYALICKQCHSHNGMALKEEFEFIGFRCCYCFQFNPPRNKQPPPPRLTLPIATSASPALPEICSSSDGDSNASDSDHTAPVITPQENESDNEKSPVHRLSTCSNTEIEANLVEDLPFADTDEESTQEYLQHENS